MAPKRRPERDKAFEIWRDSNKSIPLKDIADQLGISETLVRKWKCQDKWDEKLIGNVTNTNGNVTNQSNGNVTQRGAPKGNKNAAGHGAPKGNKNAVGNKGGPPSGSKNALKTGEYETIWFDCLTEEEQALCSAIDMDTLAQVEEDIRLITIRERRMLERIKKITDGLTEKQRKVLQELVKEKVAVPITHEVTGETRVVSIDQQKMVTTEITETEFRKIDDILKLEEALTRVQEKKTRLLTLKHTIESSNQGNAGTDAAKDHAKRVQEAWANR